MTVSMKIRRLGWGFAWRRGALSARDPVSPRHLAEPAAEPGLRAVVERTGPAVDVGELPRGAPRRHAARRGRRRRLLPRGASQRSAQQRTSAARVPVGAGGRRRRGGDPARRAGGRARQERPDRPPGDRREGAEAEEIRSRQAEPDAVGARADHRSRRDPSRRLGELRRRRIQARDRVDRQAAGRRLVRAVQGPARGPDPRPLRLEEGSRQALRPRPQARRHGAAHRRVLRHLAVAQRQQGRGAEDLQGVRRATAASSADRRGDGRPQQGQARCRRSPTARRRAPPKCSMAWARRSAAAAARTWAWSISSLRSISRRTSRWRCSRSPTCTSR